MDSSVGGMAIAGVDIACLLASNRGHEAMERTMLEITAVSRSSAPILPTATRAAAHHRSVYGLVRGLSRPSRLPTQMRSGTKTRLIHIPLRGQRRTEPKSGCH